MKPRIQTLNLLLFFVSIIILICLQSFRFSDHDMAVTYVIAAITTGWFTWYSQGKQMSIFLFFLLTYHLFIGGRFFSHFIDPELDIFETTYFYKYSVTYNDKIKVFSFALSFVLFAVIGHTFVYLSRRNKSILPVPSIKMEEHDIDKLLDKAFPLFVLFIIPKRILSIINTISVGYGATALGAEVNVSFVDKFLDMFFLIALGLAIAYSDIKHIKKYFILYCISSVLTILSGSRAALGSFLLMSIWTYSRYYKLNVKKLITYVAVGAIIMMSLFSFSVRSYNAGLNQLSPLDACLFFLHSNGVTLMVHEASTRVSNYPILSYVQSFITGSNYIYSLVTGTKLAPEQASFSGHLCYELNPNLYYSGAGLGWSCISDLYLFSGGSLIIFCLWSFFIGYLISDIDKSSESKSFFVYMAAVLSPGIYMMSRGTINSLFAMFPYIYFIYYVVYKITPLRKN